MKPRMSSDSKKAFAVNPAAGTAGDEGLTPEPATGTSNKMKTTRNPRQVHLTSVDAPSFLRTEADFITNDGETLTIAAQFHNNGDGTFDRLVLINDYAIRCDAVDDLIIALGEARDRGLAA